MNLKTTISMLTLAAGTVAVAQQPATRPGQPTQPAPGQTQPSQPGAQPTSPSRTPTLRDPNQPGQPDRAGSKIDPTQVSQLVFDWPASHKEAIRDLMQKYGNPTEATSSVVVWKDAGPFKKVCVFKEEAQHLFPAAHTDFLESCVMMRVPADKIDDLARFDGSIVVNRTRGTVGATCDKEENNILALNLAHDIVTDKKSVEEARAYLAKAVAQAKNGSRDPLAMELQFRPDLASADPDQPARMLGTPETPLKDPAIDQPNKDTDPNPGKKPGEIPKTNPEVPRR